MSQDSEISGKRASILRMKSEIETNPFYYLSELFSQQEKQYIHQRKEKLENEVSSLKSQVSDLESISKSKQHFVPKGELYELKYQIIDSFNSKNLQSYVDLIHSLDKIQTENIQLQKKIIFYEEKIEQQFELRKSISEENDQIYSLFNFSDLPIFDFPKLTNAQYQDFTKINIGEVENNDKKNRFDFFIEKIHEQISWSENRLNVIKNEINKLDIITNTYNETHKRNAANAITTEQQTFSKKNQISFQCLKTTIDNLQKVWEDTEKVVNDLENQNEKLRQKKLLNALNFTNEKARLKMLKSASLECYKKQLSEMKIKTKQLRRLINSKADEYDLNCESLLNVFNEFDQKLNDQNEKVKKIWDSKNQTEKNESEIEIEEEEEEIELNFNNEYQSILLNELQKKRNDLENDIKVLKKHLKRMVSIANNKNNTFILKIENLKNKEKRNKSLIKAELSRMQKLPQNKNYKYFDKIDASMLKLGQILEKS